MNNKPLITLYTPGNKPDLIEKASRFEPDGIIIDFEDAVPLNMKSEVRNNISQNIIPNLNITTLVRVNSEKEFLEDDLRAVVNKNIYGIALPMAESVSQVKFVDQILTDQEKKVGLEINSIKLLLLIETALGVIKCYDICSAAERVESIVFGSAQDGTVVAQFFSASEGVGILMQRFAFRLNMDGSFAALIVMSLMGLSLFTLMEYMDYKVIYWRRHSRMEEVSAKRKSKWTMAS